MVDQVQWLRSLFIDSDKCFELKSAAVPQHGRLTAVCCRLKGFPPGCGGMPHLPRESELLQFIGVDDTASAPILPFRASVAFTKASMDAAPLSISAWLTCANKTKRRVVGFHFCCNIVASDKAECVYSTLSCCCKVALSPEECLSLLLSLKVQQQGSPDRGTPCWCPPLIRFQIAAKVIPYIFQILSPQKRAFNAKRGSVSALS